YPVVVKGLSTQVAHKTDVGLVVLGCERAADVRRAVTDLGSAARVAGVALDGFLVAEQITGGVETVIGVVHDELFGPVVMFGLGGEMVEVFDDVAFRVPPFDRSEARRMVDGTRAARLLGGTR